MKMRIGFIATKLFDDATGHKSYEDTPEGMHITMVASAPDPDRSNERIPTKAWREFKKPLPKLHWSHRVKELDMVIGKLTRVYVENDMLMVDAVLNDKVPGAKQAQLVADYIRQGAVDQGSVGFLPHAWTEQNGRKVVGREYYAGPRSGRTYDDVEMIEFSLTTIPDQARSIITSFKETELAVKSLGLDELALAEEAEPADSASLGDTPPAAPEDPPATPPATPAEPPPADEAEKNTNIAERDWLDELLGRPATARPGAAVSRAEKDTLTKWRDALRSQANEIDAAIESAERAENEHTAARAAAQGGA